MFPRKIIPFQRHFVAASSEFEIPHPIQRPHPSLPTTPASRRPAAKLGHMTEEFESVLPPRRPAYATLLAYGFLIVAFGLLLMTLGLVFVSGTLFLVILGGAIAAFGGMFSAFGAFLFYFSLRT